MPVFRVDRFPTNNLSPRNRPGGSWFQRLERLARSAWAVTEPAGRLHVRSLPENTVERKCSRLTVLSANLWHDWPRFRNLEERVERFARLAEGERADLILLQEVARTHVLRVDEWLGERLRMASVYSRANGHQAIGFEEGLAVLSRFPLDAICLRQFTSPLNPFVRRLALGAAVETPCGRLLAFSVHLGLLRRENAVQVHSLVDWITRVAAGHTALVGGDFNAHETTRQMAHARKRWLDTFRHLHPQADGTTHTLRWLRGRIAHRQRLDYIFLHAGKQRWEVSETRHLEAPDGPHSDHRAVLTRLVSGF